MENFELMHLTGLWLGLSLPFVFLITLIWLETKPTAAQTDVSQRQDMLQCMTYANACTALAAYAEAVRKCY